MRLSARIVRHVSTTGARQPSSCSGSRNVYLLWSLQPLSLLKVREVAALQQGEIEELGLYIQDATAATGNAPAATEPLRAKVPNALGGSQSLAGNKHATLALHVPIVTVLFFAPRNGSNANARAAPWVRQVLDAPASGDARFCYPPQARDAALWAEKIAPIMDITIIDLRYVSLRRMPLEVLLPLIAVFRSYRSSHVSECFRGRKLGTV